MNNKYIDIRYIAVFLMSISSGLPIALVFSTLATWYFEVGVSKTVIGIAALVGLPYTFKFLWAPIIDVVRIPVLFKILGQMKSWLLVVDLALVVFLLLLAYSDPQNHLKYSVLCALGVAFFSATQDIIIDAYRVKMLEDHEQAYGASVSSLGYRLGMLVSGFGSLILSEYVSWDMVYTIMPAFIILGILLYFDYKRY